MKIKRILAGMLAATITVSSMANSAFANCLKKVDGDPGLISSDSMWMVQVYNTGNPEENKPETDYNIDLSAVTGVSFTLKIVEDLDFFEGQIGGAIVLSCNGGDIGGTEDDLFSKYHWSSKSFWGIVDPELDIYTCYDELPVIAEKIDSYTYRYTYNGFANPFVEDGVQSIDCMQVVFQEWGSDLCLAEITECDILDKDGNVLLHFDSTGLGYRKSDYTYEILSDGTVEITKYNGSATELEIPSEIDGYTVTSIGYSAFEDCTSLTSVAIPDSVTSIGRCAFKDCTSLSAVDIPDSVTSIGNYAFSSTAILDNQTGELKYVDNWLAQVDFNIQTAVIKDGTVGIAEAAFSYCDCLTSVNIPNTVKNIGESAFQECMSLQSVTIPNSVTSIGNNTFRNCPRLTSVTIPDSVTKIGVEAFRNTAILNNQTGELKYVDNWLVKVDINAQTAVIKDGTVGIADFTAAHCLSLESLTIPEGVKYIGKNAFFDCVLKSVTIPKSVISIGDHAIGYTILLATEKFEYQKEPGFKIYCYKDTAGEKYAIDNGFDYELLDTVSLKAITGFKASTKTDTTITLKWNKNSEATGYILEQYKGNKWVRIAKITDNATTSYKVSGLTATSRNAFRIQAYKEIGSVDVKSAYTNKLVVYTNPKNMSGFKASSKSDSVINLTWAKNSTATGYIIEQYKGNKWVRIAKLTSNATTSYKVTGLSASTRYAFRIQAYKEIGSGAVKSAYTNKLVVYTNPKAMSGFKASAKTKSTITLSWTKNTSATGYIVEQYKGNKWVRIAKLTNNSTTSLKVTGLKANTRYAFRIQAYKNIGSGAVKSAYTNKLVVYTKK